MGENRQRTRLMTARHLREQAAHDTKKSYDVETKRLLADFAGVQDQPAIPGEKSQGLFPGEPGSSEPQYQGPLQQPQPARSRFESDQFRRLSALRPEIASKIQKLYTGMNEDQRNQFEMQNKQIGPILAQLESMPEAARYGAWPKVLAAAQQLGIDITNAPQQYNKQWVQQRLAIAQGLKMPTALDAAKTKKYQEETKGLQNERERNENFLKLIAPPTSDISGGGSGDDLIREQSAVTTGSSPEMSPDGTTVMDDEALDRLNQGDSVLVGGARSPNQMPTVREVFQALPGPVQQGILNSPDGARKAFSKYLLQRKGFEVEFDDTGRVTRISQGGAAGSGDLGRKAQGIIESDLIDALSTRMQLAAMQRKFKPEFQQVSNRVGYATAAFQEKWFNKRLDPEVQANLDAYTEYRSETLQMFTDILKRLSGAAVTRTELQRAERWLPNVGTSPFNGDSPSELRVKMNRFMDFSNKIVARLNYAKSNGLGIKNVPLDAMPAIMARRGNELEKNFKKSGLKEDQVDRAVRDQLAREFGLVPGN
jgi:hypothetical protein|tara:strand:+ start:86 stop:1699 length:1614 start_codon:yes stop_codon:yes gene_type:complete